MPIVSRTELITGAIEGKVVSFPTDTVPALAALPPLSDLIFLAKKRSQDKPLILMGASVKDLWPYVMGTCEQLEIWQQIAQEYLPGALTLVLPASGLVPRSMNPTDPTTIGIRVPQHQIAQMILAKTGPLATTSANLSGEPALLSMSAIAQTFPDVLTLNDEEKFQPASGLPSTVVKWTSQGWEVLRQGQITLTNL
ncbi:SUA5/yciO/yrdC domain protein [Gloeothece citriformis PCC 7424]|uniref:L-threonylcarbamoyladenylate synthase n=1 Tax=Gloeothece citriformis (strain PCC 7424) TaxID=65393 RepID=B7KIP3_GLOC7|nr:L-threonylcarbamoyladenylate synthase [Gloeothece citriformis]ACK69449.1 SUA5/yciO/yrdC domain protein [Gloeothece citriformis PCC 7424]